MTHIIVHAVFYQRCRRAIYQKLLSHFSNASLTSFGLSSCTQCSASIVSIIKFFAACFWLSATFGAKLAEHTVSYLESIYNTGNSSTPSFFSLFAYLALALLFRYQDVGPKNPCFFSLLSKLE